MLENYLSYIGKTIQVIMDRPMGSTHPKWGFLYPINYGYVPNTLAEDGEEIDAYVLGVSEPIEKIDVTCIAVVERHDDLENKLVAAPAHMQFSPDQIRELVHFQEKAFDTVLHVG